MPCPTASRALPVVATLLAALGTLAAAACGRTPVDLLIDNVRVVTPTGVSPPLALLIRNGRIVAHESVGARVAARQVVAGEGRYAVAGLIDLHQHAAGVVAPGQAWLVRGVTTIRDPGGIAERRAAAGEAARRSAWPDHTMGSAEDAEGGRARLRVYAGPTIDFVPGQTEASVREIVRREAASGARVMKLYSRIPIEHARAAVDEAHRLGMRVTWHLSLPLSDAIDVGVDGVEHLYVFRELLPPYADDPPLSPGAAFLAIYRRWAAHLNPSAPAAEALFDRLAASGIVWTPTLTLSHRIARGESEWSSGWGDTDRRDALAGFEAACRMVAAAHARGVVIGAGTDTEDPAGLHEELARLARCGLGNAGALAAATTVAARALGEPGHLGTLHAGAVADVVLVDGNPLDDLGHLHHPWLVIAGGVKMAVTRGPLPAGTGE